MRKLVRFDDHIVNVYDINYIGVRCKKKTHWMGKSYSEIVMKFEDGGSCVTGFESLESARAVLREWIITYNEAMSDRHGFQKVGIDGEEGDAPVPT